MPFTIQAQDVLKLTNSRLNSFGEIDLSNSWKGISGDNFN